MDQHLFEVIIKWTGNIDGKGTYDYRKYSRDHILSGESKPDVPCSSDPVFRGDKSRYNPEQFLVASLSGCHMLWFLHLCADNGIVVMEYSDHPVGIMEVDEDGKGRFTEVTLQPHVIVREKSMIDNVNQLHDEAHDYCFIANSVSFTVKHKPVTDAM